MLVHPRNVLGKVENILKSSKITRKRKSSKSKRNLLKDLPDDILYSIVEFPKSYLRTRKSQYSL